MSDQMSRKLRATTHAETLFEDADDEDEED